MADGTIFIQKNGTGWELTLTSSNAPSSLKCERGWKNRKGLVGRNTFMGPGAIDDVTEAVLDKFLTIPDISYVNIKDQNFVEFSFERPLRRLSAEDERMEDRIIAVIRELLEWDTARVEEDYPQPRAHIVPVNHRTR
jgi:hypothetical protein